MSGQKNHHWLRVAIVLSTVAVGSCQDVRSGIGNNEISMMAAAREEASSESVPVPISVQILPQTLLLPKGITATLATIGRYPYESKDITPHVVWTSNDADVAQFDDVKNPHLLTAKNPGEAIVTTTIGDVSTTVVVRVVEASVRRLVIDGADAVADLVRAADGNPIPSTLPLRATAVYSDQTPIDVTSATNWTVAKPEVAAASETTSGNILFSSPGETTITGSYTDSTGTVFQATVIGKATLRDPKVKAIRIESSPMVVPLGAERSISVTAILENDVEVANVDSTCRAKDDTVGEVEIRALKAVKIGITVVSCSYSGALADAPLVVTDAEITGITVLPADLNQPLGVTALFQAVAKYSDGTEVDVTSAATWEVANEGIATISNAIGTRGHATSTNIGTTSVSAAFTGVTGSTNFIVTDAQLTKITITPGAPTFPKGSLQAFQATGVFTDGTVKDVTLNCNWTSGNAGTLTVSNSTGSKGLATGSGDGTTTLRASMNGISQTITVIVTPAAIVSFQIVSTTTTTRPKGLFAQYRARAVLTDASTMDYTEDANWSFDIISAGYNYAANVSNTVGTKGRVTALDIGKTKIIAAYDGKTAALDFVVTEKQPTYLTLTAGATSYYVGNNFQSTATLFYTDLSTRDVTALAGDPDLSINYSLTSNISYTTTATVSAVGLVNALWPSGMSLNATVTSVKFGPFGATHGFSIYTLCDSATNAHSYHCVYLGALGESCSEVCSAASANYHPATSYFYGSAAPNSNECTDALRKWYPSIATSDVATGTFGGGLGCGVLLPGDGDSLFGRYTGPATINVAKFSLYRRVCACDR